MDSDEIVYRGMTRTQLDAAYNNDAAFPHRPIMGALRERSPEFRDSHPGYRELRYGQKNRNAIDYFPCGISDAPTLAFFHGGYWQMGDAKDISCLAEGPLSKGINVAMIGYTLAPDARLTDIVSEARTSIAVLAEKFGEFGERSNGLFVAGWSAGAHLAASCMDMPDVAGGLVLSGIFELDPIRLCYLNEKLRLDDKEVSELSPIRNLPDRAGHLITAVGGNELAELQRQSWEYADAWVKNGLAGSAVTFDECDHFEILEKLYLPNGELVKLVQELTRD